MRWIPAAAAFLLCALEGKRRSLGLKNRVTLLNETIVMLNNFSIGIRCRQIEHFAEQSVKQR